MGANLKPCVPAGKDQVVRRPEGLQGPSDKASEVIDVGGCVRADCRAHAFDDGVVSHAPCERRGSSAHANGAPQRTLLRLINARCHHPSSICQCQEPANRPGGKTPPFKDSLEPRERKPLKGFALVCKEYRRLAFVRPPLATVSTPCPTLSLAIKEVVDDLAVPCQHFVPEGPRVARRHGAVLKMPERSANIRAAATTRLGCLVRRQQGLHRGAHNASDRRPEESAKAGGELQRSHVGRSVPSLGLEDPDEYVDRWPEHSIESTLGNACRVKRLPK